MRINALLTNKNSKNWKQRERDSKFQAPISKIKMMKMRMKAVLDRKKKSRKPKKVNNNRFLQNLVSLIHHRRSIKSKIKIFLKPLPKKVKMLCMVLLLCPFLLFLSTGNCLRKSDN